MKLFSDRQKELERVIDQFERHWTAQTDFQGVVNRLKLSDGSPAVLSDPELPTELSELLWELALIDIELRLKAGQAARVEEYLAQFPGLKSDHVRLVELIKAEFAGRSKTEPDLQWDEYGRRFPVIRAKVGGTTTTQIGISNQLPKIPDENCFGGWTRGSGRFRLLRSHREGGLGKVWVAHDQELDREIIVKEIRDEFADDADSRARFAREAVITSALEHPGIVPVYGLGHRHDGRPYYAMRLIRGRSMRQVADEFHTKNWTTSGERSIALQRMLNHFLDVCHTIEYAHQKGVIHRDLKPSNIMIGEFGETMVVDWGLAKDLSVGEDLVPSETTELECSSRSKIAQQSEWSTIAGKAMGSPSYMSPEQANGDQSRIGLTTDVYGLGSTLYTLLSNRRPVEGSNSNEVMERVQRGETIPLSKNEVARPLAAICARAMSFEPADRYLTVRDLADDVERYLADEPVQALHETLASRAARFGRRNQHLVRIAAVAMVVVTAIAATSALMIDKQRLHAERLAESESIAQLRTSKVLEFFVNVFQLPSMNTEAASAIAQVLDDAVGPLRDPKSGEDPLVTAGLLTAFSDVYQNLGRYDAAIRCADESMRICSENAQHGSELWMTSHETLATAQGNAGDTGAAIALFQRAVIDREAAHGCNGGKVIEVRAALSRAYSMAGRMSEAVNEADRAVRLLDCTHKVSTRTSALTALASSYSEVGRVDEALEIFKECVELTHAELDEKDILRYSSVNNYAAALLAVRKYEQASELLEPLVPQYEELFGVTHPNALALKSTYAKALVRTGKQREAAAIFEEGLQASRELLGDQHPSTLESMNELAWAYAADRKYQRATELLELSYENIKLINGSEHPVTLTHLNNLARSYMEIGRIDEAIANMKDVVRLRSEVLPPEHPHTLQSLNGLAYFYECSGDFEQAVSTFEESLKRRTRKLGHANVETFMTRLDLGHVYVRHGAMDKAIETLNQQVRFLQTFDNKEANDLRAASQTVLAHALLESGEVATAVQVIESAQAYFADAEHQYSAHAKILRAAMWDAEGDTARAAAAMSEAYQMLRRVLPTSSRQHGYRLTEATERLEKLYAKLGQPKQRDRWRLERQELQQEMLSSIEGRSAGLVVGTP